MGRRPNLPVTQADKLNDPATLSRMDDGSTMWLDANGQPLNRAQRRAREAEARRAARRGGRTR
ncbi:hypothetical protein [Yinghuangia soli]|uniref:Uncharacterized protein n=1 Tax=Yinghuangia soli TaxID=2908204 RepID=A0AA41PWD4_9ACTN|nr:hypothetical protein [Yinghuangia soli]MCF2526938.1 hypothetical protein [Yinghuangia soli]